MQHAGAGARGLQQLQLEAQEQSSGVMVPRPRGDTASGIFPDQGPNPRPMHWQENS